jgi:PAS domain S-box-containing protein
MQFGCRLPLVTFIDPVGVMITASGNCKQLMSKALDGQRRKGDERLDGIQRAEAALRASEELWQLVFQNSAIGVVLADERGNFVEANRAFQELVGYTNEELKRLNFAEITHEEDIPRGAQSVNALSSGTEREVQIEKRYRHKDGRYIWVRASGAKIPGSGGSPDYLMGRIEQLRGRLEIEPNNREVLTSREREIVQLIAEGHSSKKAATTLGISVKTIENHRANIMRKLQLGSVMALVRYAIRQKIVQP